MLTWAGAISISFFLPKRVLLPCVENARGKLIERHNTLSTKKLANNNNRQPPTALYFSGPAFSCFPGLKKKKLKPFSILMDSTLIWKCNSFVSTQTHISVPRIASWDEIGANRNYVISNRVRRFMTWLWMANILIEVDWRGALRSA